MKSENPTRTHQQNMDELCESSSDDDFGNFINNIEVTAQAIMEKNNDKTKDLHVQNKRYESIYSPSKKKNSYTKKMKEKSPSFDMVTEEKKMHDGIKEKSQSTPYKKARSRDMDRRRKHMESIPSRLVSTSISSHADIIELKGSALRAKYRNEEVRSKREEGTNLAAIGEEHGKPHPIHSLIEEHILSANERARSRTLKMLQSKKCDMNVHNSWTSNMESLNDLFHHSNGKDDNILPTKIDIEQIKNGESQIQSVGIPIATAAFRPRLRESQMMRNDGHVTGLTMQNIESQNGNSNDGKGTLCPLVVFESVVIKMKKGEKKSFQVSIDALIVKDSNDGKKRTTWEIKLFNSSYQLKVKTFLSSDRHEVVTSGIKQRLTKIPSTGGDLVYKKDFRKPLGNVVIKAEASVHIRCMGMNIVAVINFVLHEETSGNLKSELQPSLSLQVPTYEIIARLHKYHKCKAFDGTFWELRTNGDLIWTPLVNMVDFVIMKVSSR